MIATGGTIAAISSIDITGLRFYCLVVLIYVKRKSEAICEVDKRGIG